MAVEMFDIPFDAEAVMLERPNRFLAIVDIISPVHSSGEKVHVRDPGRLEEILYPGNRLLLKRTTGKKRKTGWDLVAGKVGDEWILINSGYHRRIAEWVLEHPSHSPFGDVEHYRAEQKLGRSRIDFLVVNGE